MKNKLLIENQTVLRIKEGLEKNISFFHGLNYKMDFYAGFVCVSNKILIVLVHFYCKRFKVLIQRSGLITLCVWWGSCCC